MLARLELTIERRTLNAALSTPYVLRAPYQFYGPSEGAKKLPDYDVCGFEGYGQIHKLRS